MTLLLFALACDSSLPADSSTTGDTAGRADTADTAAPFEPPDWCPAPTEGRQEVTDTPASPYFVTHPEGADAPLVLFLPGGPGDRGSASATWEAFFDEDSRGYRLVVPYVTESGYPTDVVPPVAELLDEVLTCFGGDPAKVHLAGHSNGGYLAYNVVGPDLAASFVTITGAPAYFNAFLPNKFSGVAFHNSAGELDTEWLAAMEEAHATLLEKGFDSQLTVWPDTDHTPGPNWTGQDAMFEFWDTHPMR
ncbi:hypothetical protein LBMAG42_08100 [Deltaproteobacteria bacterium]|nr:hypothetical protein LBMAG42_08100 [Deltaproteobacteria bacterium]